MKSKYSKPFVACFTFIFFLFGMKTSVKANTLSADSATVIGRWDITIYADGKEYPSWLEIQSSGHILVGEFVGIVGSARPEASHGDEPYKDVFSAVYVFIAPSEIAAKKPGEWQSFDITLVGRMLTVMANGKQLFANGKFRVLQAAL